MSMFTPAQRSAVNDAKATAVTGAVTMAAMFAILLAVYGWLAAFFAALAAFGFLMFCVGVDRVSEITDEALKDES